MSAEDELARKIEGNIAGLKSEVVHGIVEHGWYAMSVFSAGPTEPGFSYTIGLWPDHPEVIVIGLPTEAAHPVLAAAYERVQSGERFEGTEMFGGLLPHDYPMAARPVGPEGLERLAWADWYHAENINGVHPFEAVQLVWPDAAGRFPWHDGCEITSQPMLSA